MAEPGLRLESKFNGALPDLAPGTLLILSGLRSVTASYYGVAVPATLGASFLSRLGVDGEPLFILLAIVFDSY